MVEESEKTKSTTTISLSQNVRETLINGSYHEPAEDTSDRCRKSRERGVRDSDACVYEEYKIDDKHSDPVCKHQSKRSMKIIGASYLSAEKEQKIPSRFARHGTAMSAIGVPRWIDMAWPCWCLYMTAKVVNVAATTTSSTTPRVYGLRQNLNAQST